MPNISFNLMPPMNIGVGNSLRMKVLINGELQDAVVSVLPGGLYKVSYKEGGVQKEVIIDKQAYNDLRKESNQKVSDSKAGGQKPMNKGFLTRLAMASAALSNMRNSNDIIQQQLFQQQMLSDQIHQQMLNDQFMQQAAINNQIALGLM